MSNEFVMQQSINYDPRVQILKQPAHLILLKETNEKGKQFPKPFLALKLDKGASYVDATGFFISKEEEDKSKYSELIDEKTKNSPNEIREMSFPWDQIVSVQNLNYRHKGAKNA